MCMEYKFFILTLDEYMNRTGVDMEELLEMFGKRTKLIVEAHLTDIYTGEQHRSFARYEGAKTFGKLMEELAIYMQAGLK